MVDSEWEQQRYRRTTDLMVAEYNGLRNEIVTRIGMQHQIISVTLITAAAFLGLGSQSTIPVPGAALLMYPILAMFLALSWAYQGVRLADIGEYLMTVEEESQGGLRWEHHMHTIVRVAPMPSNISTRGVFITTQLLALGLAVVRYNPAPGMLQALHNGFSYVSVIDSIYVAFLVIDIVAVLATVLIARQMRRPLKKPPSTENGGRSALPTTESPLSGGS